MKDPAIGDLIDRRYELRREVARGGMGIVYEALQRYTRRTVALKVLHPAGPGAGYVEEHRDRLLREAHALTTVRHPHFVEVLDAGLCDDHGPYVALEMLEGRTLDGILASRQRLGVTDVVHIGRQICEALAFAHARGVVHRDLKPSNVFIARTEIGEESVKLLDLGIAAIAVASDAAPAARAPRLTHANEVLGTPEYMAPEQLLARAVDQRADIYGLGITLFECLIGEVPYVGTYPEILLQVTNAPAPPNLRALRRDIDPHIAAAIEQALAKEAAHRYPDAMSFARALVSASGLRTGQSALLTNVATWQPPAAPAIPLDTQDIDLDDLTTQVTPPVSKPPAVLELVKKKGKGLDVIVPSPILLAPPAPTGAQRRRHPRAPYVTPVHIVEPGGRVLEARSEDVSESGLLLVTSRVCQHDEELSARFALPMTGAIVTMRGVVRWVRAARGRQAIGLEFLELPPEVRFTIARYVELVPKPIE